MTTSPLARPPVADEVDILLPGLCQLVQEYTPLRTAQSVPEELPEDGSDVHAILARMRVVMSGSVNIWTDRFLEKLYNAPTATSVCADMLLSALNAGAHVYSASPLLTEIELICVQGLAKMFGLGDDADGVTMPGGAASNTLALQTALANAFDGVHRTGGVLGIVDHLERAGRSGRGARPAILTSSQGHFSLQSAAIAAGLGADAVVSVPSDSTGRMCPTALKQQLEAMLGDAAHPQGYPFFVNATSGTTVLGAFDNLQEIAAICRQHKCWMHVDASFGGAVIFSPKWRYLMDGVENADSLTFNPHKLLCVTQQCSFLLVRRAATLNAHSIEAGYLFHKSGRDQASKTLGCGRRSDALKLYLSWLRYGVSGFGQHIESGFETARRLREYIAQHPRLELGPLADPLFLQLCFRPKGDSASVPVIRDKLLQQGKFAVDFAPVQGETYFRLVTHPRVPYSTFVELVEQLVQLAGN
ncbi:glutamate decarboxylase [Malassezia cuniculi]|uniref:Glutamate decarboxylase n=1 Tax=Malassezia cuniculi TaxID=948313 RepID=A0AAF0JBI4_9BASI|nr:glutamate decarboxylase [Malassezia cuniculi]